MTPRIVYEKGEDRCANCGAFIRNIVRIDDVPYGVTCADRFLPRSKRVGRNFQVKLDNQDREQVAALHAALIDYAYTDLPEGLQNRPNAVYENFLRTRPSNRLTLKVIAILQARSLNLR